MFLLELVPLTSVLFLPLIPESPRFLLVIRQKRDAAEAGATLTIPMTSQLTSKHFLYFFQQLCATFMRSTTWRQIWRKSRQKTTETRRKLVASLFSRSCFEHRKRGDHSSWRAHCKSYNSSQESTLYVQLLLFFYKIKLHKTDVYFF